MDKVPEEDLRVIALFHGLNHQQKRIALSIFDLYLLMAEMKGGPQ